MTRELEYVRVFLYLFSTHVSIRTCNDLYKYGIEQKLVIWSFIIITRLTNVENWNSVQSTSRPSDSELPVEFNSRAPFIEPDPVTTFSFYSCLTMFGSCECIIIGNIWTNTCRNLITSNNINLLVYKKDVQLLGNNHYLMGRFVAIFTIPSDFVQRITLTETEIQVSQSCWPR